MPSANMCSAKEGMGHGTHLPNYREIASHASFVLWSQDRQGQSMEFSSPFITGLWCRAGWERARVLAGISAIFPAALWLHLPPSTGLQLAVLVHQLQTLNWHIYIVQMGQSQRAGLELIKNWNILDQEKEM